MNDIPSRYPKEMDAIIITSTKICSTQTILKRRPYFGLTAKELVAMDPMGRPLAFYTIGHETARLDAFPHDANTLHPAAHGQETEIIKVAQEIAEIVGEEHLVVGWDVGNDLASIHLAIPASNVIDLATDPIVRECFRNLARENGKELPELFGSSITIPIPFCFASWIASGARSHLRVSVKKGEYRDLVRDGFCIAAIWRALGFRILKHRLESATSIGLYNSFYVGGGQSIECMICTARNLDDYSTLYISGTATNRVPLPVTPPTTEEQFWAAIRVSTAYTKEQKGLKPSVQIDFATYMTDLDHYNMELENLRQAVETPQRPSYRIDDILCGGRYDFDRGVLGTNRNVVWFQIIRAEGLHVARIQEHDHSLCI